MTQHFRLSSESRNLSIFDIASLSEEEAYSEFVSRQFAANEGEPFCPHCGSLKLYSIAKRKQWRCAVTECGKTFSATSGTIFKDRKMSYRVLLMGIALFTMHPKGISSLQLAHTLGLSYKSAFVLNHKLMEVTNTCQEALRLDGEVEIDGGYFGGYRKPANDKPSKRNRRLLYRDRSKQKVVVIIRERYGPSRAIVCPREQDILPRLSEILEKDTIVFTDKFSGSGRIAAHYQHFRVNHSENYADGWISTNWAESYFSVLRRCELGTHHHIAGGYILHYANAACWRQDRRGVSDRENFCELIALASRHPVSRLWKGYWQRRKEAV